MLDTKIQNSYQKIFINPIIRLKFFKNLNPNIITLFSSIFGVFAFFFIIFGAKYLAVYSILLSGYFDTLDGAIARKNNSESNLGTVLDIFSDRVVETLIIIALFLVEPTSRAYLSVFMLASCYLCVTSFLVVGIFEKNLSEKRFHYSIGLIERTEAFIFFISMIIYPNYFSFLSLSFSFLVSITAFVRIFEFYKKSKAAKIIKAKIT